MSTGVALDLPESAPLKEVRARRISERPPSPPDRHPRRGASRGGRDLDGVQGLFRHAAKCCRPFAPGSSAAAAELGYQPNTIAQSLRRGATHLIGFVAADLSDPFSAEIVAGAEYVLRPAGYRAARHELEP